MQSPSKGSFVLRFGERRGQVGTIAARPLLRIFGKESAESETVADEPQPEGQRPTIVVTNADEVSYNVTDGPARAERRRVPGIIV